MKTNRIQQLATTVFLFVLFILSSSFSGDKIKTSSEEPLKISSCDNSNSNSNPDYVNKYKKIETYIPDENTPIKHIKIAFNIFTGPGTIQNTPSSVASINQLVQWINGFYTNVDSATYPIAGVPRITDTKIRFDLDDRIFFYEGTKLYTNTSIGTLEKYIIKTDSTHLDYLNIFITDGGKASPYSIPPYPGFILKDGSNLSAPTLYSSQGIYISSTSPCYVNSQTLAHELGHCLDLFHTYNASCCHETCDASDPEYLYDLFGTNPPAYCWEHGSFGCKITVGENTCTNNIMGGDNMLNYYFSPMQVGKMHRALSIKSARKYVKDSPYNEVAQKIKSNEIWNFDIRWYSDIIIQSGATLTVTGKILMADQAQIIIKRGAQLIVDGGIITSANQTWQGVKIKGEKKSKGEKIIFKNGGVIEHELR
jgi:hypothetical protein